MNVKEGEGWQKEKKDDLFIKISLEVLKWEGGGRKSNEHDDDRQEENKSQREDVENVYIALI